MCKNCLLTTCNFPSDCGTTVPNLPQEFAKSLSAQWNENQWKILNFIKLHPCRISKQRKFCGILCNSGEFLCSLVEHRKEYSRWGLLSVFPNNDYTTVEGKEECQH